MIVLIALHIGLTLFPLSKAMTDECLPRYAAEIIFTTWFLRAEMLNWLFWQVSNLGPIVGACFGHFFCYAPGKESCNAWVFSCLWKCMAVCHVTYGVQVHCCLARFCMACYHRERMVCLVLPPLFPYLSTVSCVLLLYYVFCLVKTTNIRRETMPWAGTEWKSNGSCLFWRSICSTGSSSWTVFIPWPTWPCSPGYFSCDKDTGIRQVCDMLV